MRSGARRVDPDRPGFTNIIMEIGDPGNMGAENIKVVRDAVRQATAQSPPRPMIDWVLGGYDDDPRDLWDIAQARRYICACAREVGIDGPGSPILAQFGKLTIALLQNCFVTTANLAHKAAATAMLDVVYPAVPLDGAEIVELALRAMNSFSASSQAAQRDGAQFSPDVAVVVAMAAVSAHTSWRQSWNDQYLGPMVRAGIEAGMTAMEAEVLLP